MVAAEQNSETNSAHKHFCPPPLLIRPSALNLKYLGKCMVEIKMAPKFYQIMDLNSQTPFLKLYSIFKQFQTDVE